MGPALLPTPLSPGVPPGCAVGNACLCALRPSTWRAAHARGGKWAAATGPMARWRAWHPAGSSGGEARPACNGSLWLACWPCRVPESARPARLAGFPVKPALVIGGTPAPGLPVPPGGAAQLAPRRHPRRSLGRFTRPRCPALRPGWPDLRAGSPGRFGGPRCNVPLAPSAVRLNCPRKGRAGVFSDRAAGSASATGWLPSPPRSFGLNRWNSWCKTAFRCDKAAPG